MAVDAQVLPVRAVRGIVPVVAVFVVNGQQAPVFIVEIPAALGAYEPMNFERSFPVVAGGRAALSQFPEDLVYGLVSAFFPGPSCH